jgi:hypothetical protein
MAEDELYFFLGTFDLRGKVVGDTVFPGGSWRVKQDNAQSLRTGARLDTPDGSSCKFKVLFTDEDEASDFLAYVADKLEDADIPLHVRSSDWCYDVWGVHPRPLNIPGGVQNYLDYEYEVTCYLYSAYSHNRRPATWLQVCTSLPQVKSLSNRKGHYPASFESLQCTCRYNSAHVENLSLAIAGSVPASIILVTKALTDEVWELLGNEDELIETYLDPLANDTLWEQDVQEPGASHWETPGTYHYVEGVVRAGWVWLAAGDAPYYKLSGPHRSYEPVKLYTHLIQNGDCGIDISSDAIEWTEVLTDADFIYSGASEAEKGALLEFALPGTEGLTDIYVRFRCTTGAMYIGSVKFEVKRWIELDKIPMVAAGATAVATVDVGAGSSEHVDIDAEVYQYRLFI